MPEKKFTLEELKNFINSVFQLARFMLHCLKESSQTQKKEKTNRWHNEDGSFNANNPVGEKLVLSILNYIDSIKDIPEKFDSTEEDFIAFNHHLFVMQIDSEPTTYIEEAYFIFYASLCNMLFSEEFISLIVNESLYKGFKLTHLEAITLVYSTFRTYSPGNAVVDIYTKQKILALSTEEYYQLFPDDAMEI